jgi:4-carboxymuconolactone decarboxylase
VSPKRIAEAILQTYLFAGYPRSINGLVVLRDTLNKNRADISWDQSELAEAEPKVLEEAGATLFERVYADKSEDLKARITEAHPLMARWMIREGYGRVLSRAGLDGYERELLALSSLLALGVSPQVKAHIGGAFNLGATKRQILETVYLCIGISPVPDRELYLEWAKKL